MRTFMFLAFSIFVVAVLTTIAILVFRPIGVQIEPAERVPLAAVVTVTSREPTSVSLTHHGRHHNEVVASNEGALASTHSVDLLGLYPDSRNELTVRAETADGKVHERRLTVETAPLPDYFPTVEIERHAPDLIAPGMTFMILGHYDDEGTYHPIPSAVDEYGDVRWFYDGDVGHVLRPLANGNLLISEDDTLVEIDRLGRDTGRSWELPNGFHHDAEILPDGNVLALSAAPGSFDDGLVEIDTEGGELVREWDFREILDPDRPRQPVNLEEADWLHLNAVEYEPRTGEIIVSGRDQSAVVSIDRQTGALQWILGSHDHWREPFRAFLLEPVGTPFAWQWGQHAPMVHPTVPGRILVYDNGNKRSYDEPLLPTQNYSRAVEYEIDRETMTVRQLWEYGREYGSELYTPFIGDADYLPNGNRLVTFGGITRTLDGEASELFDYELEAVRRMKISARVVEVSSDTPAREIMTIVLRDQDPDSYRGYRVYRSMRMPLYPPPTAE